ncbi:MAG: FG-GAP-like repeat-containing protein [bacterium]
MPAIPIERGRAAPWGVLASALLVWALPGCSDLAGSGDLEVTALEPVSGSAVGGQEVSILGRGFESGARVWFGDVEATVVEVRSAEELRVTTPSALAGLVGVSVRNPGGDEVTATDAFTFLPLELRFVEAASHFLPALEGLNVSHAASADFDGDGNVDIVVAVTNGESRILYGNGSGSFEDSFESGQASALQMPRWDSDTRRVVVQDFDGNGAPDILACNGSGAGLRLLVNGGGGQFSDTSVQALPESGADCVFATAADLNDDGLMDLVVIGVDPGSPDHHLTVLWNRFDGVRLRFEPAVGLTEPLALEGQGCGTTWASDPALTATFTFTHEEVAGGAAAGRMQYDFSGGAGVGGRLMFVTSGTAVNEVPSALELDVFGDNSGHDLYVELRDSGGEYFYRTVMPIAWTGWLHVRVEEPATWEYLSGDANGLIDPAVDQVGVGIVSQGGDPQVGAVLVDDIVLEFPAAGRAVVEDFERMDRTIRWPDRISSVDVADVDGDGLPDLALSSTESGSGAFLRLLINTSWAGEQDALRFLESDPPRLPWPDAALSRVVALDVDGDGDSDLVAVSSSGQDRLFVNDGAGYFFDDTLRSMPLDRVDGRGLAVADLDLDGIQDLLIANYGAVNRIYLGRPDGSFVDQSPAAPLHTGQSVVILALDVDRDHDTDFVVFDGGGASPRLYVSVEPSGLE